MNTKEHILKNVGNQTVHGRHWIYWLLSTVRLPTFFKIYSVLQKKTNNMGLEQLEGE